MPLLFPGWFLASNHFQIPPFKTFCLAVLAWLVPHTSRLCLKICTNKQKVCSWDPSGRPSAFPAPPWGCISSPLSFLGDHTSQVVALLSLPGGDPNSELA